MSIITTSTKFNTRKNIENMNFAIDDKKITTTSYTTIFDKDIRLIKDYIRNGFNPLFVSNHCFVMCKIISTNSLFGKPKNKFYISKSFNNFTIDRYRDIFGNNSIVYDKNWIDDMMNRYINDYNKVFISDKLLKYYAIGEINEIK